MQFRTRAKRTDCTEHWIYAGDWKQFYNFNFTSTLALLAWPDAVRTLGDSDVYIYLKCHLFTINN